MRTAAWISIAAAGLTLGACSVNEKANQQAETNQPADDLANAGVNRQEVAAPKAAVSAPQPAALQTQPGPKGSTVMLNRVAVTGDILTVALSYTGGTCCDHPPLNQVSVIDDATSQRISVLKDNAGQWMAGPLDASGDSVNVGLGNDTAQVWFKFPAPPATSKTVSLTIPNVAPFDAVPVAR